MKARVFISCGQNSEEERQSANDLSGQRDILVLHGDIANGRLDRAAYNVIAQLFCIQNLDTGEEVPLNDRTLLKASGFVGYYHTIWPASHCAFDLFAISVSDPELIFLNSSLDVARRPIISKAGTYRFVYRFIAEDFPILTKALIFSHTGKTLKPKLPVME